MSFLFNLAYLIFGICYLPVFLAKSRLAPDRGLLIRERLGFFAPAWNKKLSGRKIVWVHAVSVGEVMAVENFIRRFLDRCPGCHVVLTTVTPTGQRIAKKLEGDRVAVGYFPFDMTFCVRRFLKNFRPACLLLAETEVWPNLLGELRRAGVSAGILNGRLSPKSAKGYRRAGVFFRPVFRALDFVLAQTEEDAERFVSVGVEPQRVRVLGNIKFDGVTVASEPGDAAELKGQWGWDVSDPVLVAGSTHPGEESVLGRTYRELRKKFPGLKMMVAPRHIERSGEILAEYSQWNSKVALTSSLSGPDGSDVLILDELGKLKNLYGMAEVVFVGGSLVPRGGQNPIEAAALRRAVVHGPLVTNFEMIYRRLDEEGGALCARDEREMLILFEKLLQNPDERDRLGENAARIILNLQGATDRHVAWLSDFLALEPQMIKG